MALSLLPTAALAESETTGAGTIKVGDASYESFSDAVNAATPDENGVITYEISGKVDVTATDWVQVAKAGLTTLNEVKFVGKTPDAEICITQGKAILADQSNDIDVSFDALKLTKLNPQWTGDYGHSTNYFTCWLRNNGAAENTVTYTNCTFPNGVCNNQYGNTVFDNCQFTNSANYNLWNYGGNTEVKDSEFTGTRGIKAYSEGTDGGDITVADTTFTNLTDKAAIVVSKATDITLTNVTATDCTIGLLQKDIEGSKDEQKVTIKANGTGISGEFNITAEMDAEAAKNEFNITAGTFTGNLNPDYLAPGATINESGTVEMNPVAKVGTTEYNTLEAAFAALDSTAYKLELLGEESVQKAVWPENTPVYWKAGDQSDYAATLTDALTAAYKANAGDITIVCRPGADVGTMTHGHVADTLTIYGNDAYISDGECDLEVDQYKYSRTTGKQDQTNGKYLEKDITITAYELDNLGVWGTRNTSHTVTINLNDCDGKAIEGKDNPQRVYINGTSGVNDITLINCDFLTKATAVYSNADGEIVIDSCSFTGGQAPVNFNHKDSGTQTVTVKNSTFTTCGDDNTWKMFAAPLRFVNSGNGSQTVTVDNTTITDTVGSNGDILLGDGRAGEQSKGVSLTITNTAANVQAQKPGYYGADGAVSDTSLVRKTSVANSATPVTITLDSDSEAFDLAQVGDRGYSNLTEAITAAQSGDKTVTLLTADDALLQAILDGQYGSIDGLTIELSTGSYGQLVLGRATKYAGSNTEYYVGGFDESSDKYKKFDSAEDLRAYKNSGGWTPNCYYVRNMKDVTLKAAAGADVEIAGMTATAGHIYGTSGAPVTDYVLDTETESTVGSYYLAQNWGNITFDGLTFTAKVDIASSLEKTAIDGVSFENCNFNINNMASGNQALRYYNELDNEKVSGLTVDNCTFTNCFQGVYTQKIKNITVTNSTFDTTAHNAIAIQSGDKAANHGDVVITNNTFTNIGDRIIRFNNVAQGTNITITGNTATNSGDETGEVIKATSVAEGVTTTIYSNNWGPGTTVGNDEFQDTAAPSPGGSSSYTITTKDTDNGSISVSPSRASSGRTVTITVDPDEGYVLDELTVTDSKGEKVELTKVSDTKYTFTMPRSRVTIEATFAEDPDYVEPDPSTSVADIFDDIQPGAWYEDAVQFAYDEGIMTGTSKTTFEPNTTTTRGMIVSILHRLEGNPVVTEEAFSDVSADDWYGKAVAWASSEGIVGGYGDGTFQPNKAITREEMASILYRYAQYKDQDVSARADLTKYTDADQVGAWAEEVMQWANAEGLINGMTEDTLVPQGNATRAQVAAMFQRYLNK